MRKTEELQEFRGPLRQQCRVLSTQYNNRAMSIYDLTRTAKPDVRLESQPRRFTGRVFPVRLLREMSINGNQAGIEGRARYAPPAPRRGENWAVAFE